MTDYKWNFFFFCLHRFVIFCARLKIIYLSNSVYYTALYFYVFIQINVLRRSTVNELYMLVQFLWLKKLDYHLMHSLLYLFYPYLDYWCTPKKAELIAAQSSTNGLLRIFYNYTQRFQLSRFRQESPDLRIKLPPPDSRFQT